MRGLMLACLAALVFGAAASGSGFRAAAFRATAGEITWTVDQNPIRITLLQDGKVLLQEHASARLRYQLAGTGEQHSLTSVTAQDGDVYTVATDEPGRTATVQIARRPHGVRISVSLQPATGIQQIYDAFDTTPQEHFMGGGERGNAVDLRGQILPVKVSYVCSYAPAPFFISSAGYGLRLAGGSDAALAFPGSQGGSGCTFGTSPACSFPSLPDRVEVCMQGDDLEEDVYPGGPPQAVSAYTADVGAAAVPPPSQFALIKWRDRVSSSNDLLEDADRLRAAGIPDGWVLLDNPWETCPGTFQWDPSRFPDPAGLVQQLHARGVKLMLWVSPDVFCGDGGYPPGSLVPTTQAQQALDLANPDVLAAFTARLRAVLALGIDGVKGDRADEGQFESLGSSLENTYPLLFAQAVVGVLRSLYGNDFATIFRAATPGEQSLVHGFWAGDQPGDFTGLQRAIHAGADAGLVGMSVWGSDVGGFASDGLTPEVFARWAQLGAISPVMEVGGTGPNATPWVMGRPAMDALRAAAVLHYELFPYLYSLVRHRLPVLRPLAYGFPSDAAAWSTDNELMVGPQLIAAPVIGGGTTPSVYLPRGTWIDLYTGLLAPGPATFTRQTPLDQFPLYVRAGAVLPFDLRTATGSWWGLNELQHAGRAGYLATNRARLALLHQPRSVQIFVPAPAPPRLVTIAGRRVQWTWNAGPLPGVVVRLHGPTVSGRIVLS